MKRSWSFLFTTLLLILTMLTAACSSTPASQSQGEAKPAENKPADSSQAKSATPADTLFVGITADQGTLDPAVTFDNSAWKITYPTYQRLVEYDGATTEVKPGLAKDWKVSEDGLNWTFTLAEGNTFADGTPVNAEAVKFTFDRILKIKKGPADVYSVIKEVKVDSPTSVTFVLSQNFPPFLSTLAANYGGIVNPKVMEKEQNGDLGQNFLSNNTMGSGPYQLTEWRKGEYIKLTPNPNSSVKPALQNIFFKIIPDSTAQRLQLEQGEIDIAEGIPNEQLKAIKDQPNLEVLQQPSLFVDYIYVNSTKGNPALQNPKVRQALSYAIDYDALTESVQEGFATQMRGPIPKGLWGHDESAHQYKRDVEKAKALLAEAGATNLSIDLLYSDNKAWWETEALTLQAFFSDIGVKLNLKKIAYATSREMIDKGEFDLAMGVWSPDFGDPYMFMNYWFDSNNFGLAGNRAFYKNDKVDELVRKAASINDKAEREKIYQEAQKIVIDEAPYLYLYQKDFLLPVSKSVKGFVYNPMLEGIYNLAEMSK
ncbi:peptide ABC transporter substrate-binding protein [Brevibacillus reuszeri]|uniref:Peptide ABC transporter substrate-binding protein n=1 Tax=Brevibacillus reuszeri TaxID=54915 RepID=A0A0K9YX81_9BACL|nr:ABC transporter substrate-binding protein [Brevibacillus reuszeri]KNB73247.1 peptide ABC transporter substrate-binding protein [Brevibacillus reuszeri]MED1856858.1 ABC transporter substrate-binding protein [Brevibacillus reuszeri]GED68392.1 peptide ABC transporter substrate-binding protein [Brevibacillus reuszeri]